MAIIYTYPDVGTITGTELLICSDVDDKNATRSMTTAAFGAYIQSTYGPGNNIYQADGSLISNRTLSGGGFDMAFDVNNFDIITTSDITLTPGSGLILDTGGHSVGDVLTSDGIGTATWQTPTLGTVTSVASAGTINGVTLIATPAPITGSGTITLGGTLAINNSDWSGAALSASNGGTGIAGGYAIGDILYATGASTLINLPSIAAGNVLTSNGVGVAPSWQAGGGGIYGGSGSLGGATVVTTGANDLTFTATTGDILFNNNVAPNPSIIIDGATNSVGIGGNANFTDELSIYNITGSLNTTAVGVQGNNATGDQIGIDVEIDGAAVINTALRLSSTAGGTNHALVTKPSSGNSGFGVVSPDPGAIVEMVSTTQGLLIPRWTTVQQTANTAAWAGAEEGMTWFNSNTKQFMGWSGAASVILG